MGVGSGGQGGVAPMDYGLSCMIIIKQREA